MIMGIIHKKGVETIDYTLLQKKGFIKKGVKKELPFKVDSRGMIDLTPKIADEANNVIANAGNNGGPFNFLDSLAGLGGSQSVQQPVAQENNSDFNTIKVKIDDLEYKLERLVEKILVVESKLENFERKVGS